jgi:gliding motility-associated-like protein
MRLVLLLSSFFVCSNMFAQAPAVIQWQKSYGGTLYDLASDIQVLPDGSYVVLALSNSNDGDITGHHGPYYTSDISVLKFDPTGNLLWQRAYGGVGDEVGATIISTGDGGFIFTGKTNYNDGDVSGNHGDDDVWVVKLDASGNIQWQKCYGGTEKDVGSNILEVSGGYMIAGITGSTDGDVSGQHGGGDLWVIRIDGIGNLLWQKCYGGTLDDGMAIGTGASDLVKQTADGGFIVTTSTQSHDGDVSNMPPTGVQDLWVLKITATGTIVWDNCYGGNFADLISQVIINSDGTIFMAGFTYSKDLPGSIPGPGTGMYQADAWALKLDASGNTIWLKVFGGSDEDRCTDAAQTPDGGYILSGSTLSSDGIVCKKHLFREVWLVKLDAAGDVQWSRTFGGNKDDIGMKMALTSAGDCVVISTSLSSDGDLTMNRGFNDLWLTSFSFTGLLISPSVNIRVDSDSIVCSGKAVKFVAVPVNGGTNPIYQWKLNGVNIGGNSDTINISNMLNNDVVSCVLTSNSPCVDIKTVNSNNLKVKVDPRLPPSNFLAGDTALCSYQKIELGPNSTRFTSFLWSDGSTTQNITVKKPGLYWLEVTDRFQCVGRDTVTIFPKTCIEGVFIPNAFSPNRDGKNDEFMPIMNADVKQFRFIVYDRWGRIVFQTTSLNKGWDGKVKDLPYDTGVFAWQCQYQLDGEEPTLKRGTVLLLR